jgi:hypothetical protein
MRLTSLKSNHKEIITPNNFAYHQTILRPPLFEKNGKKDVKVTLLGNKCVSKLDIDVYKMKSNR